MAAESAAGAAEALCLADAGGQLLVPRLKVCRTSWEKTVGLLNRDRLEDDEGLWIGDCRVIHTVGMRFVIDVVFFDEALVVRKVVRDLKPLRLSGCLGARHVLELPAGVAERLGLAPGQAVAMLPRTI